MSRLRFFIWIFIKTFLGGILCYLDFLVLVSKWPLKKQFGVDSTYVYYVFLFLLLIILLWYTRQSRHKMQGEKIFSILGGSLDLEEYLVDPWMKSQ